MAVIQRQDLTVDVNPRFPNAIVIAKEIVAAVVIERCRRVLPGLQTAAQDLYRMTAVVTVAAIAAATVTAAVDAIDKQKRITKKTGRVFCPSFVCCFYRQLYGICVMLQQPLLQLLRQCQEFRFSLTELAVISEAQRFCQFDRIIEMEAVMLRVMCIGAECENFSSQLPVVF